MSTEKHTFIAYREPVENVARKLAEFLLKNKIKVWFFPWRVGWADSVTAEEEAGLENSFSGILIYYPSFMEGRTARQEYRALHAMKRLDDSFKIGILRVNCTRDEVPPFMLDSFDCYVESETDENFDAEAEKILRGLRGLPLESPPTFHKKDVQIVQSSPNFDNYKEIFTFAREKMFKSTVDAQKLTDKWMSEYKEVPFTLFQEVFTFSRGPILMSTEASQKFAEEWISKYMDIPFEHFVEIYNFARSAMLKSTVDARKFAIIQVNKF